VCLDHQPTRDANGKHYSKHYNHAQRWAAELRRIVGVMPLM
jgi:hypothetical protein